MKQLYKVTKIQYRRTWDNETRSYTGEYQVYRKRTDYRTNKGAVTLAFRYAEQENDIAQRRGLADPWKYEVQVEVTDLPDFKPAVYCDKHGVQPAFNVPGLTSELTCVDCI
jgi:hypothetical protein